MQLKESISTAVRDANLAQNKSSQIASSLELMDYAFQAMEDKEPVSYQNMPHKRLSELARNYADFIYRIRTVIQGIVDTCYSSDMNLGTIKRCLTDISDQQQRLEQYEVILNKRSTPEESNVTLSDDKQTRFIIEQDALLSDIEHLLAGDYKEFDKDIEFLSKH